MTPLEYLKHLKQRCRLVVVEHAFGVARPRLHVWDDITDTNALNLRAGMAPIHMRPISNKSSARYRVATRLSGFSVVYDEEPYEWVKPLYFKVTRRMVRGSPARTMQFQYVLQRDSADRTTVVLRCVIIPRFWPLAPALRCIVMLNMWLMRAAIVHPKKPLSDQAHASPGQRVLHALKHSPDAASLRPRPCAEQWDLPVVAVVAAFLRAVSGGFAVARLEAACPSCRLPIGAAAQAHPRCHMCDIPIIGPRAATADVLFAPHASLGPPPAAPPVYCPGGPARTPHICDQVIVPPGGVAEVAVPKQAAPYMLTSRGGGVCGLLITSDAPPRVTVNLPNLPDALSVQPGGTVVVNNTTACETHVRLEAASMRSPVLTLRDIEAMAQEHPLEFAGLAQVIQALGQ